MKKDEQNCKGCEFWHNRQAELEYDKFYGICVCNKWKFTTTNESDVVLLDRGNRSNKYKGVQRFENLSVEIPIGKVTPERYAFVTAEKFCCMHYSKKK